MELYAMLAVFLENPFLSLISIGGCTIQFLLRITTIHHGKSGNHTDQPVFLGTTKKWRGGPKIEGYPELIRII